MNKTWTTLLSLRRLREEQAEGGVRESRSARDDAHRALARVWLEEQELIDRRHAAHQAASRAISGAAVDIALLQRARLFDRRLAMDHDRLSVQGMQARMALGDASERLDESRRLHRDCMVARHRADVALAMHRRLEAKEEARREEPGTEDLVHSKLGSKRGLSL